tara:strand:- start:13758 stop:14246 length:489 start_codon:yes stop_codon:yes gene_type:complete
MIKKLKIRSALKDDMSSVYNLINELAKFERNPDQVIISVNDLKKHGFGKNPLFKCIVAEIENQIVGMALFYPRYSTWRGPTIHLEDLIVKEKWKSNGIGRALYKEFIQYAFSQKVRRVEWVVLDWNKNAIDFYNISGAKVLQDWRTVQMDYETMDKYLKNIN